MVVVRTRITSQLSAPRPFSVLGLPLVATHILPDPAPPLPAGPGKKNGGLPRTPHTTGIDYEIIAGVPSLQQE